MSHHSGTIHTVRFSPNGRYVASGADDKFVLIYILDAGPPPQTSFGTLVVPTFVPVITACRIQRGSSCRELAHLSTTRGS